MSELDTQLDAAEYVLGTLSAEERRTFEAMIELDDGLRADVESWERTLADLGNMVAPEIAPEEVWERISQTIASGTTEAAPRVVSAAREKVAEQVAELEEIRAANDNTIAKLTKSRGRWRFMAVAASLAIAALGALLVNSGVLEQQPQQQVAIDDSEGSRFISVVNANGDQPSLIVEVDTAKATVTVRSIGVEKPEGKSLEIWYVPHGERPISVGLVETGRIDLGELSVNQNGLFAISLEPEGGSPTGTATGPIVYTGRLVENVEPEAKK